MGIKVTVGKMVASANALREMAQMPMNAMASYRIAKILHKVDHELVTFQNIREKLIVEKYGELQEDGRYIVLQPSEKYNAFLAEIKPLLENEIELEGTAKLTVEMMGDVSVKPETILLLEWMIEDEQVQ